MIATDLLKHWIIIRDRITDKCNFASEPVNPDFALEVKRTDAKCVSLFEPVHPDIPIAIGTVIAITGRL